MTFKLLIQRIHLWVGLLLGVQVFLWMFSGVVMTWFHLDLVRGERTMFKAPPPELEATAYASPGGVIAQVEGATSIELRSFLNRPVYEVRALSGGGLFDASTGAPISPIKETMARNVAKQDYIGDGEIVNVSLMSNPPHEYRKELPVWRIDFDDRLHTRIYVSQTTGMVAARRNDIWRVYDFFWMLHIMDYDKRVNFNNWFVKFASAIGLVFALSGLFMLVLQKSRRIIAADVNLVFRRGRSRK